MAAGGWTHFVSLGVPLDAPDKASFTLYFHP